MGVTGVEIMLDHRRAERRTVGEAATPERRRGERRQRPPFRERAQWAVGFRVVRMADDPETGACG
jgi:hypothetical protein